MQMPPTFPDAFSPQQEIRREEIANTFYLNDKYDRERFMWETLYTYGFPATYNQAELDLSQYATYLTNRRNESLIVRTFYTHEECGEGSYLGQTVYYFPTDKFSLSEKLALNAVFHEMGGKSEVLAAFLGKMTALAEDRHVLRMGPGKPYPTLTPITLLALLKNPRSERTTRMLRDRVSAIGLDGGIFDEFSIGQLLSELVEEGYEPRDLMDLKLCYLESLSMAYTVLKRDDRKKFNQF